MKATREGLVGQPTASRWIIDTHVPFVALPSRAALYRFVRVTNVANSRSTLAIVLDVGPFNEHDDAYVLHGARPQAESGVSVSGHGTNGAGIDLGECVWNRLAMTDNGPVQWEFIDA